MERGGGSRNEEMTHGLQRERMAGRRILRWMKRNAPKMTRAMCAKVCTEGVTGEMCKSAGGLAVVRKLCWDKKRATATYALARRIRVLALRTRGGPARAVRAGRRGFTKSALAAAFLMESHPETVFSDGICAKERAVGDAASRLVALFDVGCVFLQKEPMRAARNAERRTVAGLASFPDAVDAYTAAFCEWQTSTNRRSMERVQCALGAVQESMLVSDRVILREQEERLRYRVMHLGGVQALRDVDADAGDGVRELPRGSAATISEKVDMLAPVSTKISSAQLAHELLVDPGFRLKSLYYEDAGERGDAEVRLLFDRAYWDGLQDDLEDADGPFYVRTDRAERGVREDIIAIAEVSAKRGGSPMAADIIASIRARAPMRLGDETATRAHLFWLKELVLKLPGDTEQKAWWAGGFDSGVGISYFFGESYLLAMSLRSLSSQLDVLRLELENALLVGLAEKVKKGGIEYERRGFQREVMRLGGCKGGCALRGFTRADPGVARTRAWVSGWTRAGAEACGWTAAGWKRVHSVTVAAMVSAATPLEAGSCPETFYLDVKRLQRAQKEFRFWVGAATAVLLFGTSERLKGYAGPTADFLASCTADDREDLQDALAEHLGDIGPEAAADMARFFKTEPSSGECAVHKATDKRLTLLWCAMCGEITVTDMQALPPLLARFVPKAFALQVPPLRRMIDVNWEVYGGLYRELSVPV